MPLLKQNQLDCLLDNVFLLDDLLNKKQLHLEFIHMLHFHQDDMLCIQDIYFRIMHLLSQQHSLNSMHEVHYFYHYIDLEDRYQYQHVRYMLS